jgi:Glu-tRNA(Gln) amidotransferase subunit E-like FAD-binding protein
MQLISIELKIYDQTCPPRQSNEECHTFTPNIFNYYPIMNDLSKQIILGTDTIVCLLDEEIIESLNSHETYKAKSLFNQLWKLDRTESSINLDAIEVLEKVLKKVYRNNIENSELAKEIDTFLRSSSDKNPNVVQSFTMDNIDPFINKGVNCNLLQPDGKGWQKGTLKLCFEFTPEENESIVTEEKLPETNTSPLDEIRQLSNELTSMTSLAEPPRKRIEQN